MVLGFVKMTYYSAATLECQAAATGHHTVYRHSLIITTSVLHAVKVLKDIICWKIHPKIYN